MNTINLGFISFTVWPVVLLIGIFIGLVVTLITANKHKSGGIVAMLLFLLSGLIAGRFLFVVQNIDSYNSIAQMLNVTDGGINYTAALIASLLVFAFYQTKPKQRKALNYGALTLFGVYGTFTFLIAVASSHAVLPDNEFVGLDGSAIKITEVSGQNPVVVNLWATPCDPCRRELALLEQAAKNNPDVSFIYLNQTESLDRVRKYIQSQTIQHQTVLLDTRGITAENKGIFTFPVTLFFDAQGQLAYSHNGELNTDALTRGLLSVK